MPYIHGAYLKPLKIALKKLRNLQCQNCDYKTVIGRDLRRHSKLTHGVILPLACDECDYTTRDNGNFRAHVKAVHNKVFGQSIIK